MTQSQRTPADYQAQLDEKRDRLTQLFADFNPPALEVHASPAEHYRMRAEFRIWHEGDDLFHCMYAQATKEIIRGRQLPHRQPAHQPADAGAAGRAAPAPGAAPQAVPDRLPLHPVRPALRQPALPPQAGGGVAAGRRGPAGRPAGPGVRSATDWSRPQAEDLPGGGVRHRAAQRCRVASWSTSRWRTASPSPMPPSTSRCWAGRWMSPAAARVTCWSSTAATATSPSPWRRTSARCWPPRSPSRAWDSAQFNIAANGVDNLIILRMSAEEFTMAMRGEREFNRLKGVDLGAYQCNTIFVDPPRAGLDDATVRLVQEYEQHPLHLLQPRDPAGQHGGAGRDPRDRPLRPVRPVPLDPPYGSRGVL